MVDIGTRVSRRYFVLGSLAAGATPWLPRTLGTRVRAGAVGALRDKLNIAVIGCGGKGHSDALACKGENVVALCDVDAQRAGQTFAAFETARRYEDFRVMLDREKDLHAVVVSTPDHTHAVPAALAMRRGLHVFVQKPLTHTIEEARVLTGLAREHRVVTQMGNQGTAHDGLREAVEVVRSGALGAVGEVHVWTNRPVWPQGIERPSEIHAIPSTLRWDLWLGPAPHRPYHSGYAPFAWRGFWDFGTGALGDMACHTMNLPYLALELGAPTSVVAESDAVNAETAPKWSVVRYEFPARGSRPRVRLTWYDGGRKPAAELFPAGIAVPDTGSLMVGERGMLYSPGDYGTSYRLLPEADFAGFLKPAPVLPRSPGIHEEWIAAIRGEGPAPLSGFDHAGPFTEAVLLGNVALRAGQAIEWDAKSMRATNCPAADALVRKSYAWGFELHPR